MSNSLTLGLALLGGAVMVVVVGHGAWTARKTAARAPRRAEPSDGGDSVLSTLPMPGAGEPGLHGGIEPGALPDGGGVHGQPALRRGAQRLDALIDAIAVISLEAPMTGEQLLAHMPSTRRAGSKPFLVEALRADCGEWEPAQPGATYSEVQVGMLLANRLGGLNEIEYSEFVQKVQAFADSMGASVEFPDMLDAVARARELDGFASAHDAQLAMTLRARASAWSVGYLQQQASRHGFVPGVLPGRLVLPSAEDGAPPVLTLHFDAQAAFADDPDQASLRELQLAFDVPQTSTELAPFESWCAAGEALALALDAVMTDDQGATFTAASFQAIHAELQRLCEALAQRDLAAGSPAARRLFS